MLNDISYFRDNDNQQLIEPTLEIRGSTIADQSNILAQLNLDDGIIERQSSSSEQEDLAHLDDA